MIENRTDARVEISLTARWQGSSVNHNARISDLSKAGCYVDTIGAVIKGETLFLKILMPDGAWFELTGVVAHYTTRLGFGVSFVDLDEEKHYKIGLLLNLTHGSPGGNSDKFEHTAPITPWEQINLTSSSVM